MKDKDDQGAVMSTVLGFFILVTLLLLHQGWMTRYRVEYLEMFEKYYEAKAILAWVEQDLDESTNTLEYLPRNYKFNLGRATIYVLENSHDIENTPVLSNRVNIKAESYRGISLEKEVIVEWGVEEISEVEGVGITKD